MEKKIFTPFAIGERIPLKGFWWTVTEADATNVTLKVSGVSKVGHKLGYVINEKSPLELDKDEA